MTGLTIDLRGKSFSGTPVLGPLSFTLAPGERACLLGPSGIGKSTLLSLIAGFDRAYDGTIALPPGRIAMVFQAPRLLPWRTLAQNIALIPGAGDLSRARALLAEAGLADAADQYPEKVSLGMQRRAALCRALAVSPALILLDEPLVSLDPASTEQMRALLRRTLDLTGATALLTTHDRREALALTDRILEIDGRPATLRHDRPSPLSRDDRLDPQRVETAYREMF
ncbi:ABC transporter ATP-binding protein [Marinibacterium profundimaris]|nr:ABC transporter ATP-binding protein [Marinibacterium profundimaris]